MMHSDRQEGRGIFDRRSDVRCIRTSDGSLSVGRFGSTEMEDLIGTIFAYEGETLKICNVYGAIDTTCS